MFYCCFTSLDVCNCCNPPLLTYIHLYSCFTRTLLVLFLLCVCVCHLTGPVECVEESEGLRRDGAWEHGMLQQRAAAEAALHEPPHISLLILLAPAQARTILFLEHSVVTTVNQVREKQAARASYDARLPNLVSRRMAEEAARREYM